MRLILGIFAALCLSWVAGCASAPPSGIEPWQSTRISDPEVHARTGSGSYPYREQEDLILKELDLQSGDVVVDIGAGDGWWSERLAKGVGENGAVHALEIEEEKVEKMKEKYAGTPQIKPYLSETDGTGLAADSCDMAFFSQVYHHLDDDGRVDYLRHLRKVVKPDGRLAIIEKYLAIATEGRGHGTDLSSLATEAEEAGWILLRCELLTGAYHYLAIFGQKDVFPPEPPRQRRGRGQARAAQ